MSTSRIIQVARAIVNGHRVSIPALKGYELGFLLDLVRQMRTH